MHDKQSLVSLKLLYNIIVYCSFAFVIINTHASTHKKNNIIAKKARI